MKPKMKLICMTAGCICGFTVVGHGKKGAKQAEKAFAEHECEYRLPEPKQ